MNNQLISLYRYLFIEFSVWTQFFLIKKKVIAIFNVSLPWLVTTFQSDWPAWGCSEEWKDFKGPSWERKVCGSLIFSSVAVWDATAPFWRYHPRADDGWWWPNQDGRGGDDDVGRVIITLIMVDGNQVGQDGWCCRCSGVDAVQYSTQQHLLRLIE